MKLIWHIVLKDFRRLWLPIAVWLVLLLLRTVLLIRTEGLYEPTGSDYERMDYFAMTWGMIVNAVGFIMAAWLVMEDSLVASGAFWRTRPIGGIRLLAGKSLAALAMFSILPVLVLTPVWAWYGFSSDEWAEAARELAIVQGGYSVIAFALACLTEKSGQFLVRMIAVMLLGPVFLGFIVGGIGANLDLPEGLNESRRGLGLGLLVLATAVLIVHQFATRRTRRSLLLVSVGVVLLVGVRCAWPWNLSSVFLGFTEQSADEFPAVKVTQKGAVITSNQFRVGRSQIKFSGISSNAPKNSYVWVRSARGHWLGQGEEWPTVRLIAENQSSRPSVDRVREVVGLTASDGNNGWTFSGEERSDRLAVACGKAMKFEAKVRATLMRGRVLGALPLREGAEIKVGASYTRIVEIRRADEKVLVTLEERDAWGKSGEGFYADDGLPSFTLSFNRRPAVDGFLVRNPTTDYAQVPDVSDLGTVRINSIMTGRRNIIVTPPTQMRNGRTEEVPGWEEGMVIMKVRFVPDAEFARTIVTDLCTLVR